ncbi:MAG: Vms1/Ankzf1 family peptidyl-tRNA hydrolase [Candidatus Methanoperedens sp.]
MFDLFKKEEINSLKSKIAELEEENRRLAARLGKKDEKTKKSVAIKQEVDRELNEATQKISSFEKELQKLKEGSSSELKFRFSESLTRHKLDEILFILGSLQSKTSTLITIYLAKDETLKNITQERDLQIDNQSANLIEKIESTTGKAIFYDADRLIRAVIIPFLPISRSEYAVGKQFNLEPLKKSLEFDKILALNAHAGETFAAVIEDDNIVEHDIIRSSVMGKHKQGGWSQKRFQSLVEEDVKHHADKVRAALSGMIEKNRDIQYIIAGGEGKLIKMIMEGYDYPLIIKSMDAAGNIEKVFQEATKVRLYGI